MNAPHSPSPLASVPMAPADPILGVTEAFVADKNPSKVNLGVGVYTDDNGKIPLLECVRRAEELRMRTSPHRGYLPIDGLAAYDGAVQELLFGSRKETIVTVQAVGGTGGLRIGADFLKVLNPEAEVRISDPSWENHRQLFEAAGGHEDDPLADVGHAVADPLQIVGGPEEMRGPVDRARVGQHVGQQLAVDLVVEMVDLVVAGEEGADFLHCPWSFRCIRPKRT